MPYRRHEPACADVADGSCDLGPPPTIDVGTNLGGRVAGEQAKHVEPNA